MAVVTVYCIVAKKHNFAALSNYAGSHKYTDSSTISVTLCLLTVIIPLLWWCGLVTPFRHDRMRALLVSTVRNFKRKFVGYSAGTRNT
jgi:uncharacterized membrane protein YjgN (DUF898 family)